VEHSVVRFVVNVSLLPLFSELDLFSALVTFLACLLWNLAYGILVGVAVQLVFILYSIARPKVDIEEKKVFDVSLRNCE
jgi:MFS superfamily sulfate permease-like transporter